MLNRHLLTISALVLFVGGLTGFPGCTKKASVNPPEPATGILAIAVSGLPAGTDARVMVDGPDGFHRNLAGTDTLRNLVAGLYTIQAQPVATPHPVVGQAYSGRVARGSVPVVANGSVQDSVGYSVRNGSGMLWVPSDDGTVSGYTPDQLGFHGQARVKITTGHPCWAVAFDQKGNLWARSLDGKLIRYTPEQLHGSGFVEPAAIVNLELGEPWPSAGFALAPDGGAWVAGEDTFVRYSPEDLVHSGTPSPEVVISGPALNHPAGMAFDKEGSLWVCSRGGSALVKYAPDQLAASGSPVPERTIPTPGYGPEGLAFDAQGDLWISTVESGLVLKFSSEQLRSAGDVTPSVTLSFAMAGLMRGPDGLAFDNSGDLWITDSFMLSEVLAADLASSGGAHDATAMDLGDHFSVAGFPAFNPPPSGLPLAGTRAAERRVRNGVLRR